MKKSCGFIFFISVFVTIRCWGGNFRQNDTIFKNPCIPFSITGDTIKKLSIADTARKDTATKDTTDDNKRSYAIGLEFGSNQSYLGLHPNIPLPYLEPNFTYTAPSGFYAEASVQYILIKRGGGFDALDLNPGWNIDFTDNTTLNFNISHFVFKANTPLLIRSDLSDIFETYIDQSIGETEGKLIISYDYYKKSAAVRTPGDIEFSPDILHTFKIALNKKSSISFVPEGNITFGTRNGFTHYEVNDGDTVLTKKGTKKQVPSNTSFGTVSCNLSFSIDYTVGNFEIEPAINYTDPLYKPEGIVTTQTTYFTLSLTYTIY